MMAAAQQPAHLLESGGPSTEAPMIMHRVSTMEMIAAEEGEQSPKYTSNRNPSGLRTGPPEGWSHQPGWAVPTADTIADMVKSFVKDEATHLRSDYMSRVAAVARGSLERVDNLVEKFVDLLSTDKGELEIDILVENVSRKVAQSDFFEIIAPLHF